MFLSKFQILAVGHQARDGGEGGEVLGIGGDLAGGFEQGLSGDVFDGVGIGSQTGEDVVESAVGFGAMEEAGEGIDVCFQAEAFRRRQGKPALDRGVGLLLEAAMNLGLLGVGELGESAVRAGLHGGGECLFLSLNSV